MKRLSTLQRIGVVAAAVVASYGAGFFVGNHGTDPQASPAPTTSPDVIVTAGLTSAAASGSTVGARHEPASTETQGRPMLINDHGWGLFVAEQQAQTGISTIRRIGLSTGDITDVAGRFVDGLVVISGSGAGVTLTSASDVGGATEMARGPDGNIWALDANTQSSTAGVLRLVRPLAGGTPRTMASFDTASLGLSSLVGSTATGDPVLVGADGSYFSLDLVSGLSKRVASGALTSLFEDGNYSTVNCDLAGTCTVSIHGAAATQIIDYEPGIAVWIAPDGKHALIGRTDSESVRLELLDLQSGAPVGFDTASGNDGSGPLSATWTPDGSEVFVLTDRRILALSSDGGAISTFQLPDTFLHDDSLVGIA